MKMMKKLGLLFLCLVLLIGFMPLVAAPATAATPGDWEFTHEGGNATLTKYTGSSTDVTIPSNIGGYIVTKLGDKLFYEKSFIKSIYIPSTVTSMGIYVFAGTAISSIEIPSKVTAIGKYAFWQCTSLENVMLHDGLTGIDSQAFYRCMSLKSITIPDTVTKIGYGAFNECYALESIQLPETMTSIDMYAFNQCESLKTITLPKGLTTIEQCTFMESGLESITIPKSVKTINIEAFYLCRKLQSVHYEGTEADKAEIQIVGEGNQPLRDATWYCKPETPQIRLTATAEKIRVKWDGVSGAAKYQVFRREKSNGKWSTWSLKSSAKPASFNDTDVKGGVVYEYRVKAVGADGIKSGYSNREMIGLAKPSAPTINVTATAGKNTVTWSTVAGAKFYVVYWRDNSSGEWGSWSSSSIQTGTNFVHTGVTKGLEYQYRVRGSNGVWGEYSTKKTVIAM